jgi:predicted small lipoprotein YifL
MNIHLRALAVLLVAILVSSCGQSGQLYIPGDPSEMTTPPAAEPATDSEAEEGTDEDSNDGTTTE